jgi:uncharacterized protein (DUF885 family)
MPHPEGARSSGVPAARRTLAARLVRTAALAVLAAVSAPAAMVLLAAPGGRAILAPTPGQLSRAASNAEAVKRLASEYWDHERAEDFSTRLRLGLPIEHLPDLSPQELARGLSWMRAFGDRLAHADATNLVEEDRLTLALLRDEVVQTARAAAAQDYLFQVTPYDAPFRVANSAFTGFTFGTTADLARYLRLLHGYAAMVEQVRAHLESLAARGVLLPRPEIDAAAAMARAFDRPSRGSLFEVADERLARFDARATGEFHGAARRIVDAEIDPALERLASELTGGYRQRAPESIGLAQYPGGLAAYRSMILMQTGFDLAPEEIHRRGLAEVERLTARMAEVRQKLGFTGPPQTARQFNQRLRTDPRFLARTPDEVAERLMAAVHRMEPKVSSWFLRQPQAPYGVAPLPAALSGMTFGYYQQPEPGAPRGLYLYNTADLDQRPLVGAAALIYHELVPGHHFQLALQAENQALPPFRHYLTHTSFVEGWGEYASHLGEEMGLYDDPYALYGRLAMDLFLSNRLVVDTGLNALGWSRQQATDYMRDRLLESDAQIDSEILRYATSIPAQALAYKLGATQIEELRRHAQEALGPRFDVRRFHDAVLGSGSLPPSILAAHIDSWIEAERGRG